jgi:hypothetical protein
VHDGVRREGHRDTQGGRPDSGSLRGGQRVVSSLVASRRGDRAGIGRCLPFGLRR